MSAEQPQREPSAEQCRIDDATSHLLNLLADSGSASLADVTHYRIGEQNVRQRLRDAAVQLRHTCPPPASSRWPWWWSAVGVVFLFTSMVVVIGVVADEWLDTKHNALFFMIWSLIIVLGAFGVGLASVIAWTQTPRRSRR